MYRVKADVRILGAEPETNLYRHLRSVYEIVSILFFHVFVVPVHP